MKNKFLTWKTAGAWTLTAVFLSILAGIVLIRQRVFLVPPLVPYTIYFYVAIVLVPAFGVFFLCFIQRPVGSRKMLITLPIFVSVMLCCYITLIGPAFYTNIQCFSPAQSAFLVQQECQCESAPSGSIIQTSCVVERWWPLPLMRLVKEGR